MLLIDIMSAKDNLFVLSNYTVNNYKTKKNKVETMALLTKLLKEKSMTQAELAKELKRDKTTVNRWCKDSREVAWDNALKIAEVLHCHPVEIYEPSIKLPCKKYLNGSWNVKDYNKEDIVKFNISYEYNKLDIFLILFDIPGSHLDGDIGIFETMKKGKKFSRNAINRMCYLEPSKKLLAKKPHVKPIAAVLQTNNDGTFKAVDPFKKEPLSKDCECFTADDLSIASPLISKFNPILKSAILTTK